jgi:hypothetical protein
MEEKKPDTVKAFIDLKKRVLQLEGPQEFVEKYLDPIIKNCKPFSASSSPKPKPTVKEQEQLKKIKSSAAYKSLSLSLGLGATTLLTYNISKDSWWVPLCILSVIVFISGFYFVFINKWKRHKALNQADSVPIRHVMLFLGLVSLGIGLIKSELPWPPAPLLGRVLIIVGYLDLIYGSIIRPIKELIFKKPKIA